MLTGVIVIYTQHRPKSRICFQHLTEMIDDGKTFGRVLEYDIPTPNSGARCITPMSDGRLFFTQWDAGLIGEVVPA